MMDLLVRALGAPAVTSSAPRAALSSAPRAALSSAPRAALSSTRGAFVDQLAACDGARATAIAELEALAPLLAAD